MNFDFGETSGRKANYFIRSQNTPAQTTLFGALRYAVLTANDALITDYDDEKQLTRAASLVGRESFSFADPQNYDKPRDYGMIGAISPLFILDGDCSLIPVPMNHKNKNKTYTPLKVEAVDSPRLSAGGGLTARDYDPKAGCGDGWLNLSDCGIISDKELFRGELRVGINSHRTESVRDAKESFFKKEYIRLCPRSFAFFAELDRIRRKSAAGSRVSSAEQIGFFSSPQVHEMIWSGAFRPLKKSDCVSGTRRVTAA